MRFAILLIMALLAGCAIKPSGASSFYYNGTYAPGVATVEPDGSFVSTTTVADVEHLDLAGEAALVRLLDAAQRKGLSHAVVESVRTDETGRPGYRIVGRLYSAGEAPGDAMKLAEIERALRRHLAFVPRRPPVAARPAPVPVAVAAPSETVEDPVVINAPDFVN